MADPERVFVYNTPLLVNLLRFIRNRRLPPGDVNGSGDRPTSVFEFAGLSVKDCGPFKEAGDVWAAQSLLDDSDAPRGAAGSTFAGPLHMLVTVGGVTAEHWKLEDYRETHTENSFVETQEHLAKLRDVARILYTYLCCGNVYSEMERKATDLLAATFAVTGVADSRDAGDGSLFNSSIQRSSLLASNPMSSTTTTTAGAHSLATNKITGVGRLAFRGTELLIIGPEGNEGSALLKERGLLHRLNDEAAHGTGVPAPSRFDQRRWYVDELVGISVVRDRLWNSPTADLPGVLPSAVESEEVLPSTEPRREAFPATVAMEEVRVTREVAELNADRIEPPPASASLAASGPSKTFTSNVVQMATAPSSDNISTTSASSLADAWAEMDEAELRCQGLPIARRNLILRPPSAATSPGPQPPGSSLTSPTGSQVKRRGSPAASQWSGDLTRLSAVFGKGAPASSSFARLRGSGSREDACLADPSALDLYTACMRLNHACEAPSTKLSDLLAPLRH